MNQEMRYDATVEKWKMLRRHERVEARERMGMLLSQIAENINKEVQFYDWDENVLNFVNEANEVDMLSYYTKVGGPHSKAAPGRESDIARVARLERTFAHAEDYENQAQRMDKWRENRALSDSSLVESAMTILLHKALGENHIVVKSAKYDDYINGVDNIILNKETGEMVCAFDELVKIAPRKDKTGCENYHKKVKRAKDRLKNRGGMFVKYGITRDAETGEYERCQKEHVPAFCIMVEQMDLHQLLRKMGSQLGDQSDIEVEIIGKIVESVTAQKERLLSTQSEKRNDHIRSMDALIEQLRSHCT